MSAKVSLTKYRHKWENRMVAVAVLVALCGLLAIVALTANHSDAPGWVTAIVFGLLVSPFVTALAIHWNFWKETVNSVQVSDKQYPELYKIFKEQVKAGGFDYMPKLYVQNGNGLINAFASKGRLNVRKGGFVVIYSDIVDTFYELGNKDTIRFVISHELGHLKLGHINVRRNVLKAVLKPVFLQDSLVRAQEYSADRFGASITKGIALKSLMLLPAGKRNYERVDVDEYIDNDAKQISWLWVGIVNFRANHAVARRRLAAARQMDKEGWQDVHGKML